MMPVKKSKKKPTSTSATTPVENLEEKRKIENKKSDLKIILLMIKKIDSINDSSEIEKWKELAELADKIYRHAADPSTIRNTYGPVGNGVCWQDIYHIKTVIIHKQHAIQAISADLFLDLPLLKTKLLFILKEQSGFIDGHFEPEKIAEFNALIINAPVTIGSKLEKIESNIPREYNLLIIDKIKLEISLPDAEFVFNDRESKYFFARKLTIVGELLNQLSESDEWVDFVLHLKDIIEIRNLLIHQHKHLLMLHPSKEMAIANNIKSLFSSINDSIDSKVFNDEEQLKLTILELLKDLKESKIITQVVNQPATVGSKKKSEESVDKFIAKICSDLSRKVKTIDALNNEYVDYVSKLAPEIRANFPSSILAEESVLQIKAINEENKRKTKARLIEEEIERKKEPLVTKLKQIDDEYKYIKTLASITVPDNKKPYIYEHAINVIGELMEQIRNEKQKEISEVVTSMASNTFKSSQSSSIYLRKNGLSHDIFSFNSKIFDQLTVSEVLPAHDDIRAVTYILSNHGIVISSIRMMNNVATSYIRLGMYSEAIRILLEAKEYISTHPTEIQNEKMKSCGLESLSNIARFTDLDQELFGIDSYSYEIIDNLATAYILSGSIEEANSLLQELLTQIDYKEVRKYSSKFRDMVSSTTCTLAKNLYLSNDIEQAKFLYTIASNLALDGQISYSARIGIMDCLIKQGNDEEAAGIKTSLESGTNNELYIFLMKVRECIKAVESNKIVEAQLFIDEMDAFLVSNKGILNEFIGDRFFLLSLHIIEAKLKIFDRSLEKTISSLKQIESEFNQKCELISDSLLDTPELENIYIFFSMSFLELSTYLRDKGMSDGLTEFESAKQYTAKAVEISSGIRKGFLKDLAIAYSNYGTNYHMIEALEIAIEVEKIYAISNERTYLNLAIEIFNLAEKDYADKKFDEAYSRYQQAADLIETLTKIKKEPEALKIQGMYYERLWEYNQDIKLLKKAMIFYNIFLSIATIHHPDYQEILSYKNNCISRVDYTTQLESARTSKALIIEEKVINAYNNMKEHAIILKIEKVKKSDLEEYLELRLGSDIEVKELSSKKGFFIEINHKIENALKAIINNKHIVKTSGSAGLLCIDASMDPEYVMLNDKAFQEFSDVLVATSKEFPESYVKLLALEDTKSTSRDMDLSLIGLSAQQMMRFEPTVRYFFKIMNVEMPKFEVSNEVRASLDFAFGVVKINFDNSLVLGQVFESGSYYSTMKVYELMHTHNTNEQPRDLATLTKACSIDIIFGGLLGLSSASPVYGMVSGSSICLDKYQLFKDESSAQTIFRYGADFASGILTIMALSKYHPVFILMGVMNTVVMTDITVKVGCTMGDLVLNGINSEFNTNDYTEI